MRAQRFGAVAPAIDLGTVPPLSADGERRGPPSRRRVNLRWLAGTVLTGATSAALMGGALVVALEGTSAPAAMTRDSVRVADLRGAPDGRGAARKGDKLRVVQEAPPTRQLLQLATVTRNGDRELVRMKPFVRIVAPLSLRTTDAVRRIPAFDATRVYASADTPDRKAPADTARFTGMKVEGDVMIRTRPLSPEAADIDPEIVLSADEVEHMVREQARTMAVGTVAVSALPAFDRQRFEAGFQLGPGLAFFAEDLPDNMSMVGKLQTKEAAPGSGLDEKMIVVDDKTTFKALLLQHGANDKEAAEIIRAFTKNFAFKGLDPGLRLRIGVSRIAENDTTLKPVRVSIYNPRGGHVATVALADEGVWVAAQEPDAEAVEVDDLDTTTLTEADDLPSLHEAFWQTALDQKVPDPLVRELIRIFAFDTDFKAAARPGDALEVFYSVDEDDPSKAQDILYTALTIGGRTKRFYRFRSPDDGVVDYYDEQGKSAKKFLMRKPMNGGVFRSGFGGRRHPIFRVYRMHTGVDWAAPGGTPILASGTGVVNFAGWKGGYGRYVKIEHTNGYETAYGHMSAFAAGIKPGVRVVQGQVIGYVGSTGVSTGNHLHYEVIINNVHVDPMRVRLPRGRELTGPLLADFQRERERLDAVMTSPARATKVADVTAR